MTSIFFKRRRLLVDRFQYRLIAVSAIHFGFVLLVLVFALLLPLMLQLDNPAASYIEKREAADVLLFFNEQLWLPLGAVFLLLTVHSLFVSHRIAGPLYRFRAVFKELAGGNFSIRANIRKHDYLHTDAGAINEMIAALESRIRGLEDEAQKLKENTAQLKESVGSGASAEVKKALERVEFRVEGLNGRMAYFAPKVPAQGQPAST